MAVQANFPDRPARKAKDWSPIDRMLSHKRQSKRSASPRLSDVLPQLPPPAPTLSKEPPWDKSKGVSTASVQTVESWATAVSEAVDTERRRADALQKEVRSLQERLKESDAAKTRYEEDATRWKALHDKTLVDLHEKERGSLEETQAAEAEIGCLRKDCTELRRELEDHGRRGAQDVGFLKEQLDKGNTNLRHAQEECQELQMRCDEFRKEVAEVSSERDTLLKRLEVEQAEMAARVDKMERNMNERSSRSTRSAAFAVEQAALEKVASAVDERLHSEKPQKLILLDSN